MVASILIAGAGYVGAPLAAALVPTGATVHVLRRRAEHPAGTRLIQADLLQPASLKQLPACSHLVYCAAAGGSTEADYQAIYKDGLSNLLQALEASNCRPHVVYTSSTSVYAEHEGGWVDEEQGVLVQKGPSRFLVQGEEILRHGSWQASILRLGGIYGPGRSYFLQRVKDRQEFLFEGPPVYTNRIHRDDCVGMIRHLLAKPFQAGQVNIYNGVDCEAAERNAVIRWMAGQLKIDPGELASTADPAKLSHRGNKRVSNAKILSEGYQFKFPSFREGYLTMLLTMFNSWDEA